MGRRRVDPGLAVGYVRASTREQRLTPADQRLVISEWAERSGVRVVAVFEETISARKPLGRRPALMEALVELHRARAGVLVAARRDRFTRDVGAALQLATLVRRSGAAMVVAHGPQFGDTPEGKFFQHVMDAAAEFELDINRVRTSAALREKLRRGEAAGGTPPLGLAIEDGRLVPCPDELAALERAAALRRAGVPWPRVTSALRCEGFRPRARSWHAAPLARALRRRDEQPDGR